MAPKPEYTGFAVRLRLLREAAGLTQAELAEKSTVYANTIARLERGEQEPSWPVVLRLAKALRKRPNDFEGDPTVKPTERSAGRPKHG